MPDRQHQDLNEMIGRMLDERASDHDAYIRAQQAMAHMVVGVERHMAAILHIVEQTKTYLAKISPSGRPASL